MFCAGIEALSKAVREGANTDSLERVGKNEDGESESWFDKETFGHSHHSSPWSLSPESDLELLEQEPI